MKIFCLKFAVLFLALIAPFLSAAQSLVEGRVTDADGKAVAGAAIHDDAGRLLATSGIDGMFEFSGGPHTVQVSGAHFVPVTVTISSSSLKIVLKRPLETVVVTAYRSPLASMDSPASTRVLDEQKLEESAAPSLDGKLRQVPGFELFRRSSSVVANPTTEGVSLRGLGSTAASRSLVVFDDIPMSDPYGGWIHWGELPSLAIRSIEAVRGGASDLYGSSAIGGVINVLPVRPSSTSNVFKLDTSYGSMETSDNSALASVHSGKWAALGVGGLLATDGYTLVAPSFRGPVDQASNVHSQNGLAEIDRQLNGENRAFLRGSVLNESRHNGTPLTFNGTRLWRYAAGADISKLTVRLFGDNEGYRQSFSSLATGRVSETLTRYAVDPAAELGAAAHWNQPFGQHFLAIAGADTHDVRASDNETIFLSNGLLNTTGRQRQTGVYGEALWTPKLWTVSGSARVDHFSNFDVLQFTSPAASTVLPAFSETVFDPRLGIVRRLTQRISWNASGFRAYRAPTQNELYRTGQVGQQVTLPNSNLRSERATGWETGVQADIPKLSSTVRLSYFWTRVNRPITALTLNMTPTQTTLQRENLGRIESRGVSLDYAVQPARWVALEGGYQYAIATVTNYAQQPQLVGKWIPQVARNMATAQLRFSHPRLGLLSLQERASGHQFDDDANLFLLHSYFRFDAYASRSVGRNFELYASGENLFDRSIEVGKTPVLTLGNPRTARMGLRFNWGG